MDVMVKSEESNFIVDIVRTSQPSVCEVVRDPECSLHTTALSVVYCVHILTMPQNLYDSVEYHHYEGMYPSSSIST